MFSWFLIALATAVFLIGCKKWNQWKIFRRRPSISLVDLYRNESAVVFVPFEKFQELMVAIGNAYGVQPEKLRLEDRFDGELALLDSWLLGEGQECISEWVHVHHPAVNVAGIVSIRDLLAAVGAAAKEG